MIKEQWQAYLANSDDAPMAQRGVCYLPELSVVQFHGADVVAFLQGYLSCNTAGLVSHRLTPAAICNLQGRVVLNGWCHRSLDQDVAAVNMIMHESVVDRLGDFLRPYLAFSKTRMISLRDEALVLGSNDAQEFPGAMPMDDQRWMMEVHTLKQAQAAWRAFPQMRTEAWRAGLIESDIPLVTLATSEAFLPQMLGLVALGAVDFDKGCYLGQEVVARAQHRGAVKRALTRLRWDGSPPTAGDQLRDGSDRAAGTVINSAATSERAGVCLAVMSENTPDPWHHGQTTFRPSA